MLDVLHNPLELEFHGAEFSVPKGNVVTTRGRQVLDAAGFSLGGWCYDRWVWGWRWWIYMWVRRLQTPRVERVGLWYSMARSLFRMGWNIWRWRWRNREVSL